MDLISISLAAFSREPIALDPLNFVIKRSNTTTGTLYAHGFTYG